MTLITASQRTSLIPGPSSIISLFSHSLFHAISRRPPSWSLLSTVRRAPGPHALQQCAVPAPGGGVGAAGVTVMDGCEPGPIKAL